MEKVRQVSAGRCEVELTFEKLAPHVATALTLFLFHEVAPQTLRYGPVGTTALLPGRVPTVEALAPQALPA